METRIIVGKFYDCDNERPFYVGLEREKEFFMLENFRNALAARGYAHEINKFLGLAVVFSYQNLSYVVIDEADFLDFD